MGEAQEVQLQIEQGCREATSSSSAAENGNSSSNPQPTVPELRRWLQVAVYAVLVLAGQSVATLLGRLYFEKGGKSKWVATLVQPGGFPVLLPLLFLKQSAPNGSHQRPPNVSPMLLASIYFGSGLFLAGDCMLFAIGLQYLPASTFSLICASQLGFNAFFSFFLNAQKLTVFIINSLVLLTISSVLLVFGPDDSSSSGRVSRGKYIIGFVCTAFGAAGYALLLSAGQVFFQKVLKSSTLQVIVRLIIYQSLVATSAIVVGLFASGEWRSLRQEMDEFGLGKVSYVMTLVWTAIIWQMFSIGVVGLIFKVSSLFCNVISTLGLPIVPVCAVIFFHDKMDGVKAIAMLLAVWGFVSYLYQHYLDDFKSKAMKQSVQLTQLN
ncbi:purine permease 21-like [Diospyros lotus]|uniref:purine permease 21-like n=1 Tax=Diospyros lotus TaxID=55363 RepID=UPI00224F9D73|nr:purine permease 21-like [Diospyros lotus]